MASFQQARFTDARHFFEQAFHEYGTCGSDFRAFAYQQSNLDNIGESYAAMNRFDCHRAMHLLGEVVEEYKPAPEVHDLVLGRQTAMTVDDHKVTSLKPRRIVRNTGPSDTARP